ncbi:MAG: hypothetical protein ACJ72Q_07260 [Nitrososphaeraceae archaeon]
MLIYANEYNNNAGKRRDKKDVRDLTRIVIEDGIAPNEIDSLFSYIHHNQTLDSIRQRLDYKIVVSNIIDRKIVSKRFADKVIFLFSKYQKEELKLIMNYSKLIYYDPYFAGKMYSNQKTHNTAFEPEPAMTDQR